jgi:hypothetical protein
VNPNGTQEYTAYQALFLYYDPSPEGDPAFAGYYAGLSGLSASQNTLSYLLFGSDYPAICTVTSVYPDGGYFDDGTVNQFKNMTFNESAAFGIAGGSNISFVLQNGLSFVGQDTYKRILTGPTYTNGVTVSGFNEFMFLDSHGIYASDPQAGGDVPQPDLLLRADVVLNSATVHSTSPYIGVQEGVDQEGQPTIVGQQLRQPVILWEPSLTQQIVDDGYTITVPNQLCGPTIFDVVGIWAIPGYSPLYVPPAVEARSFAAPSSGMTRADESLLVRALTGLSMVREQVKRRK